MAEVASFKTHGGGTIVDVTTIGLNRNVRGVAEISRQTGVHIVAGTGYYIQAGHPAEVAALSVDALADRMAREIQAGIEGTGMRAGIIGELGISSPVHPDEEKVLRAGLRAQRETGAPVSIHQYGGRELELIHAMVREEGVDPQNVALCHMGSVSADQRNQAADRGYYVEIDCFGNEYYTDALAGAILQDPERIQMVKALVERGHLRQILISNDVALKMLWKRYGGWSYEHIQVNIKPFMLRKGLPPKAVDTIIYYNPMRFIATLD
jgi:phosphotriesterase-related protein